MFFWGFQIGFETDLENQKTVKLNFWIVLTGPISHIFDLLPFCPIFVQHEQKFWLCFDLGKNSQLWAQLAIKKKKYFFFLPSEHSAFLAAVVPLCVHISICSRWRVRKMAKIWNAYNLTGKRGFKLELLKKSMVFCFQNCSDLL